MTNYEVLNFIFVEYICNQGFDHMKLDKLIGAI